jgi:hypothetical protein
LQDVPEDHEILAVVFNLNCKEKIIEPTEKLLNKFEFP